MSLAYFLEDSSKNEFQFRSKGLNSAELTIVFSVDTQFLDWGPGLTLIFAPLDTTWMTT